MGDDSDARTGSTSTTACSKTTSPSTGAGSMCSTRATRSPNDRGSGSTTASRCGRRAKSGPPPSGRLVDVEAAGEWDDFAYLNAVDVGRDGGAASAEEAAVHIVRDPNDA